MSKYVPYKDVGLLALQHISISNGEWAYAMEGLPTIDICFCRECKHWHDHITSSWCSRGAELRPQESGWIKRNADDFCSRGERKDNETD